MIRVDPLALQQPIRIQALYKGERDLTLSGRSRLGTSVATGDFNGDGKIDIAAGASGYAIPTLPEVGKLCIFYRPMFTP